MPILLADLRHDDPNRRALAAVQIHELGWEDKKLTAALVRAVTEKFYGRTARLFLYQTEDPADGRAISAVTLRQAASEVDLAPMVSGFGLVRARLTQKDMERFERRAKKLMDDFRAADRAGGTPSSLTAGMWAAETDDA